jgi:quercetin dioxygenase-like cupin family protein
LGRINKYSATSHDALIDTLSAKGIKSPCYLRAAQFTGRPQKEVTMELKNIFELTKDRKKGQRRMDLFRRENLETWILYFPPGDVQRMHNHPSDRTYYVLTGCGVMKGLNETHELSPGKIISIPAHEYYEGSNPYDEPMILLGNSHKATLEDVAKAGGQRNEIDEKTGKRIIYQHGGGQDQGVLAD